MKGAFRLSDEYAAKWADKENLYIFSYFEDEGQIHERINAMHLTLGETELHALADEACSAFGGCDFLKNAETKAAKVPDLLAALEAVEWVYRDGSGYCPWCGNSKLYGHDVKCPRQIAIAGAQGEKDVFRENTPSGNFDRDER